MVFCSFKNELNFACELRLTARELPYGRELRLTARELPYGRELRLTARELHALRALWNNYKFYNNEPPCISIHRESQNIKA